MALWMIWYYNMKKIKLKKKHKSNKSVKWLERHLNDEYVLKSKLDGYRSRSSYKLIEINQKFSLFKNCNNILDLGSAPGGWLQVAKEFSSEKSKIVGVDKLAIKKIVGVHFMQKDVFNLNITDEIKNIFEGKVDILLSDMSPNSSGNKSIDHLRIVSLVEKVLEIAREVLKKNGFY